MRYNVVTKNKHFLLTVIPHTLLTLSYGCLIFHKFCKPCLLLMIIYFLLSLVSLRKILAFSSVEENLSLAC
uniref:SCP domain-containing protein n=1 Tax=Mesocestoides corti TaxID=53468 RepID=A0A5K3FP59_MESCO